MRWAYLVLLGALVLLRIFPEIDLYVSSPFHADGKGFPLDFNVPIRIVYYIFQYLAPVIGVVLVVGAIRLLRRRRPPLWGMDRRFLLFVLLSFLVGPLLIVNLTLKETWGRPRPRQVVEFGGNREFVPVLVYTGQRDAHSLSSGHAAVTFGLWAFCELVRDRRRRRRWRLFVLLLGLGVGFVRVMQGGHFLSDIVLAGVIVYPTVRLMHWLVVARGLTAYPRVIAFLRPIGRDIRAWWRRGWAFFFAHLRGYILAAGIVLVLGVFLHPFDKRLLGAVYDDGAWVGLGGWIGVWGDFRATAVLAVGIWSVGKLRRSRFLQRVAVATLCAAILAGLACNALRYSVGRPRPSAQLPDGLYGPQESARFHGSPSAHTTTAFGAATTVLVAVPEIGVPIVFLAGTIGWARMATLSHHPLDVMLGIFLGSLFGIAAGAPLRRLRRRISAPP